MNIVTQSHKAMNICLSSTNTVNTVPRSECWHSTLCASDQVQRINSFPLKAFQEASTALKYSFLRLLGLKLFPEVTSAIKSHPPVSKL